MTGLHKAQAGLKNALKNKTVKIKPQKQNRTKLPNTKEFS